MQAAQSGRTAPFSFKLRVLIGMASVLPLGVAGHANAQAAATLPSSEASTDADAQSPRGIPLSITLVTHDPEIPTFRERVSSWFSDGTRVSVGTAPELAPAGVFAVNPREMKVWVVLLSAERALVMFSVAADADPARYLLREVRLVSGFDELGLERLAAVIHSAVVALREGLEGFERPQVEKELVAAGLLPTPVSDLPSAAPLHSAPLAQAGPQPPTKAAFSGDAGSTASVAGNHASAVFFAGYASRLRGAEGLGHGPLLGAGARLPGAPAAFVALVSAHWMLESDFEVGGLAASVRTTALRAHAGLEPSLSSRVKLQALLGAGADLAQIDSRVAASSPDDQLRAREAGSQWRGALELTLGLWWRTRSIDWGATAYTTFLLGDVHYSVAAAGAERRLATPWPVEPGLALQMRFRSTP